MELEAENWRLCSTTLVRGVSGELEDENWRLSSATLVQGNAKVVALFWTMLQLAWEEHTRKVVTFCSSPANCKIFWEPCFVKGLVRLMQFHAVLALSTVSVRYAFVAIPLWIQGPMMFRTIITHHDHIMSVPKTLPCRVDNF